MSDDINSQARAAKIESAIATLKMLSAERMLAAIDFIDILSCDEIDFAKITTILHKILPIAHLECQMEPRVVSTVTQSKPFGTTPGQPFGTTPGRPMTQSNSDRCKDGESYVRQILADRFRAAEIIDMSGQDHAMDIHMLSNGRRYAFEIKNKASLTNDDVQKFVNDVKQLAAADHTFVGAVFISLASRNIPKKSNLAVEFINNVPAIWIGGNPEDDIDIVFVTELVIQLGELFAERQLAPEHKNDEQLQKVAVKLNTVLHLIDENRLQVRAITRGAEHIEKNTKMLYDQIAAIIVDHLGEVNESDIRKEVSAELVNVGAKPLNNIYDTTRFGDEAYLKKLTIAALKQIVADFDITVPIQEGKTYSIKSDYVTAILARTATAEVPEAAPEVAPEPVEPAKTGVRRPWIRRKKD